ncbi:dynein intermediate chain 3, ciliary-like [Bombyx mandarina]|uniref:Dynein intermediate chain 3, ciliary-like n=1 Tax=Bombyx mandarina TaxID=7092 RepID=A0A6J2JCE0_BOMMA|nr:dynein intermediate chain 3, ciliary-like [Bombyx mandarina]
MFSYIKSDYGYTKLRKNFGRQTLFQKVPAHIVDSIIPNKDEQKQYMLRNPVHRLVQSTMAQSENETNTEPVVVHEQGINHTEGGWPREVHIYNEDHVNRHRRRVMHDDNYVHTVLNLAPVMNHYLDQNNAIELYQAYFCDMESQKPVEKYDVKIANVFRDPSSRPISCIQWTNEKKPKLVVAYSDPRTTHENNSCFFWDLNRQTIPAHEITPEEACWQLACSTLNPEQVIAGLQNGIVNLFDIREGKKPISQTSIYNSHRGPITALLYTHSRTQTEFFTGSLDGQCLWWDVRNLNQPIDCLIMSIKLRPNENPNIGNAEGISSMEFNSSLSTRFLCGTESGLVLNVNRMGRTHSETLPSYWEAHSGPVRTVQRSNCTSRMFLTCGDYSVRVWSEEVHTAPIIVTRPYRYEVTDATWAPLRFSSYMVVCKNGKFYYWDFLRKYKEPLTALKLSQNELTKITPYSDGESVAVGDSFGALYLLHLSENMTTPDFNDKHLMMQTYERETRREHILDNRLKEINLRARMEQEAIINSPGDDQNEDDLQKLTDEYFKIIKQDLRDAESFSRSLSIT